MTQPISGSAAPAGEGGAFSPAYRSYALGLLVVVYIFNFIDRSILGILVEPIKQDLGVSDTLDGIPRRHRLRDLLHLLRHPDRAYGRQGVTAQRAGRVSRPVERRHGRVRTRAVRLHTC